MSVQNVTIIQIIVEIYRCRLDRQTTYRHPYRGVSPACLKIKKRKENQRKRSLSNANFLCDIMLSGSAFSINNIVLSGSFVSHDIISSLSIRPGNPFQSVNSGESDVLNVFFFQPLAPLKAA